MRRLLTILALRLAIGLAVVQGFAHAQPLAQDRCAEFTVTQYAREQFPGRTYDGTPTLGNVGVIAAASWNLAIGTLVYIDGIGTRRIADRGQLGNSGWIDVLVDTVHEALQWGRQTRQVCW